MNYEQSQLLSDVKFKRLVGVQRQTFSAMLDILETAYAQAHRQGGRKPKLSLADLLTATLQYLREYRTYEQIAADFGIHESNLIRRSKWCEQVLVKNGFHITGRAIQEDETILLDATEIKVCRPQKNST